MEIGAKPALIHLMRVTDAASCDGMFSTNFTSGHGISPPVRRWGILWMGPKIVKVKGPYQNVRRSV